MAGLRVHGFGGSFIFLPPKLVRFVGRPIVRFHSKRCNMPSHPYFKCLGVSGGSKGSSSSQA
eukprot:1686099-Amphidinium_carterae.1